MTHDETQEIKRLFIEQTEKIRDHFDKKFDEIQRHMDVVAESLRVDIRALVQRHGMLVGAKNEAALYPRLKMLRKAPPSLDLLAAERGES